MGSDRDTTAIDLSRVHPHPRGYATQRETARHRCQRAMERLERATARIDEVLAQDEEDSDDAKQR